MAIWASQRVLFDLTETFCFFYIYFIAKVLKSFQVSKAFLVAAEKIPLNSANHRFET